MVIIGTRAVYIGPMRYFNHALNVHFVTVREAAAREGNGIEIKVDDRPALRERLRRLKAHDDAEP